MSAFTDSAQRWLESRLDGVGEEIADAGLAMIREEISLPCTMYWGTAAADGSGIYGTHAPAGHPPYMETGALLEGLESDVTHTPEMIYIVLRSRRHGSSAVPVALEYGLGVQPHPYMGPAQERLATQTIPEILRARFGGD